VWECPDFFLMNLPSSTIQTWVLTVSISGGSPNGGSGKQYFPGYFNGVNFTSDQILPAWVEYGADNYAGITFYNAPDERRILIGWMTNLMYAGSLPTTEWRGLMTLPRDLKFENVGLGNFKMSSMPVPELAVLFDEGIDFPQNTIVAADEIIDVSELNSSLLHLVAEVNTQLMTDGGSLSICFLNKMEQDVCMGKLRIFLN
jgi:fructan beta-fructosidase